jgi:hypothetical protein
VRRPAAGPGYGIGPVKCCAGTVLRRVPHKHNIRHHDGHKIAASQLSHGIAPVQYCAGTVLRRVPHKYNIRHHDGHKIAASQLSRAVTRILDTQAAIARPGLQARACAACPRLPLRSASPIAVPKRSKMARRPGPAWPAEPTARPSPLSGPAR